MTEARTLPVSSAVRPAGSDGREQVEGPRPGTRRERLWAVAALGGVLGVAALAYWWTRAPLYNPSGTLDPWFYTALFVNFDEIYEHFGGTYYASRLAWIVPGRVAYGSLSVDAAYWVLHALAFCGGVTACFFLVRRHLSLAAAVAGTATLALSPMYWNAQYWDYTDGVTLTFLLSGLCFGLPLSTGSRRTASLVTAGVFFGAAVTTNPFVVLIAMMYPILYLAVQEATGIRGRAALALRDAAALVVGASALFVALGLHARANGFQFFFIEPQIDLIRAGAGQFKVPGYEWLRGEPRVLVPIFLLVVAAPLLALGRSSPPFRFAAGSYAGLAFLTTFIYAWEFLAGGNILGVTYYFSYFTISIALTVASTVALAVSITAASRAAATGVAIASTIAGVLGLALFYRVDRPGWVGRTGMTITIAVIAAASLLVIGFLLARRTRMSSAAAVLATGTIVLACHIAINSSYGTFTFSASAPDNRNLYRASLDHVAFVNRVLQPSDPPPAFWYSGAQEQYLNSVQSMYLWAYTWIGLELPKVTSATRERLEQLKPERIVMLCPRRDCNGGRDSLGQAGYRYDEETAERISRGNINFWAVLLRRADE